MSAQDYYRPHYQPETSGKALAALILGICGFMVLPLICSILAIVFGNQARREIHASRRQLGGSGYAQAGVILGWIGVALSVLAILAFAALVVWVTGAGGETTFYYD